MKKIAIILVAFMMAGCASNKAKVHVSWLPSIAGSEVKNYVMQMKVDDEGWAGSYDAGTTLFWMGTLHKDHRYYFRVVGVDSLNRVGETSPVSDVLLLRGE